MFAPPRLVVRALVLAGFLTSSPLAHAQGSFQQPDEELIDDPKVQRRLGTRVEVGSILPQDALVLTAPAEAGVSTSAPAADVVVRPLPPGAAAYVPHAKIGYRLLPFSQIGPMGKGVGADEIFHVVSLDLYPVSSKWRFSLSPQYGWEAGTFRKGGDAFLALSLALGGQIPGPTFTPFFDVFLGGGFMQRMHHQGVLSTQASAYLQWGIDVGTEVFMARYAYLSFGVGYLRGSNWWVRIAETGLGKPESMTINTWCLKVGFGI